MREIINMINCLNKDEDMFIKEIHKDPLIYFYDKSNKYYFFAELKINENNNFNIKQIEDKLLGIIREELGELRPTDTYLILIWKIEQLNKTVYPKIINLEENEFFYKKYVFYYTEEELTATKEWYANQTSGNDLDTILSKLNVLQNESHEEAILYFMIRLITKIPFFSLKFPKATLDDFDDMVDRKLQSMRGNDKEKILKLNKTFLENIEKDEFDVDKFTTELFNSIMGDKL